MNDIYIQKRNKSEGVYISFFDKQTDHKVCYDSANISKGGEVLIKFQLDIVYPYIMKNGLKEVNIITEGFEDSEMLNKELDLSLFQNKNNYKYIKELKGIESLHPDLRINHISMPDNSILIDMYNDIDINNKELPKFYPNSIDKVKNADCINLTLLKVYKDDVYYHYGAISVDIDGQELEINHKIQYASEENILTSFKGNVSKMNNPNYSIRTNIHDIGLIYNWIKEENIIFNDKIEISARTENEISIIHENRKDHIAELDLYKAEPNSIPDKDTLLIYSDASSAFDEKSAGYGVIILERGTLNTQTKIMGRIDHGNNVVSSNDAELEGVISALKYINNNQNSEFKDIKNIEIRCDNNSLIYHFNNVKKGYTAIHKKADELLLGNKKNISFKWVRGHDTDKVNKKADKLAYKSRELEPGEERVIKEKSMKNKITP